MIKKIRLSITILFYVFFFAVFITNNSQLESFAKKVEEEIILPYYYRYHGYDNQNTNLIQPQTSTHEVTPALNRTSQPVIEPPVTIIYITPTPSSAEISEEELWNALVEYRTNHGKSTIQKSEVLCQYARNRAKELSDRLATNPDDPLDNHAGFSRDADSGSVFEQTGFNTVGENLAYTPSYTSATQIIEWGWDTSPGHRSLQLSNDITHGCLTGIHPIYVGIYTY
jgi:uncharacterized protein YkwD